MNLNSFELSVQKRELIGSRHSSRLRSQGLVPVNFYGGGFSYSGTLVLRELEKVLKSKTLFNMFTNVTLDGKKHLVVAKILQKDSVTENILHVDFQIVDPKNVFRMRVPIKYINPELCNDIKLGAVLNIVKSDVILSATPEDMPAYLECDLSTAKAKVPIRLSSVEIPKSAVLVYSKLTDTIASISAVRVKEEAAAEGDAKK